MEGMEGGVAWLMSKLLYLFPSALYLFAAANEEISGVAAGVLIMLWIIGLALFVFWLWMLIDCARRDFDKKTMWLVILLLLGGIGAIAYFFAVKKKAGKPAVAQTPTTQWRCDVVSFCVGFTIISLIFSAD